MKGSLLAGRVVDDKGRPLAGAKVGLGADRQIMQSGFPSVSDGFRRATSGSVTCPPARKR